MSDPPLSSHTNGDGQPRHGGPRSLKRKWAYDPHKDEGFPDLPFYSINHDEIIEMLREICDNLTSPLQTKLSVDPRLKPFIEAVQEAKELPGILELFLAILGEQGNGKSTLINALVDRPFLDTSGSTKACTRYPTVIVHKTGAGDKSTTSDIDIKLFKDAEVPDFVREQVKNWADFIPGRQLDAQPSGMEEDDSQSGEDIFFDDEHEVAAGSQTVSQSRANRRKNLPWTAQTAREFFQILFGAELDAQQAEWLEDTLYTTDIEMTDFASKCIERALQQLRAVSTKLEARNGVAKLLDVSDREWRKERLAIYKIWPFVKEVKISTGHLLLRFGMRFFDLPGYSDTSQLRDVIINEYRDKADFEMVVAQMSRTLTNTAQEYYLNRSVKKKGKNRTILLLNKADHCVSETNLGENFGRLDREPFVTWFNQLCDIEESEETNEPLPPNTPDMNDILDKAIPAYIEHERAAAEHELRKNGIKVFTTAAEPYLLWKNPSRRKDPLLSVAQSGIPALRSFLYGLRGEANFQNLHDHMFIRMPKLLKLAQPILEKHTEDPSYARMRQDLNSDIPVLQTTLENIKSEELETLIASVWSSNEEQNILIGIEGMIKGSWVQPLIYYHGFAKMARENGIPKNGNYFGRNLNEDLLDKMLHYIDEWKERIESGAEELCNSLSDPTEAFLSKFTDIIAATEVTEALKNRAMEALEDASSNIDWLKETLGTDLSETLDQTHLKFTTEIDIGCPVAKAMKPVYEYASEPRVVGKGHGVYGRMRNTIRRAIESPPRQHRGKPWIQPMSPLLSSFQEKLLDNLRSAWTAKCDTYITDVISELEAFSTTLGDLLADATYATEEHRAIRELLQNLLGQFKHGLQNLQAHIDAVTPAQQPDAKKIKIEEDEEQPELAFAAPVEANQDTVPAYTTDNTIPLSKSQGWNDFMASGMFPLGQ